jgi:hypothetical protein
LAGDTTKASALEALQKKWGYGAEEAERRGERRGGFSRLEGGFSISKSQPHYLPHVLFY